LHNNAVLLPTLLLLLLLLVLLLLLLCSAAAFAQPATSVRPSTTHSPSKGFVQLPENALSTKACEGLACSAACEFAR
jgi:hypothetical protein